MNTAVVKATKHDGNIPKQKHVLALCSYSWENKVTVKNMLDLLGDRLRDSHWDVIYKTLIVLHIVMRDGNSENVFDYLTKATGLLDVHSIRPKALIQLNNIKLYAQYLSHKILLYSKNKFDFSSVQNETKLTSLFNSTIDDHFINHTHAILEHLEVLLCVKFNESDVDSHITLYSFKMLIRDLLKMFQYVNQGVITILKAFFELDSNLANQCVTVYKRYINITEQVIAYLDQARNIENYLQFTVPELKHAPMSLLDSLQQHVLSLVHSPNVTKNNTNSAPKNNSMNNIMNGNAPRVNNSNKKEAIDFFASLDDELAMQNYQPSHIPSMNFNNFPIKNQVNIQPPIVKQNNYQNNMFNNNNGNLYATSTNLNNSFNPFNNQGGLERRQTTHISNTHNIKQRGSTLPSSSFNPFQTDLNPFNTNINNNSGFSMNNNRNTMNPFLMDQISNNTPNFNNPNPYSNTNDLFSNNNNFTNNMFQTKPKDSNPNSNVSNLFSQHKF